MSSRERIVAAVGVLGAAAIAGRLLSLIRVAIMGHLLSPHDFGIGATFVMTRALAELLTDVGVEKAVVQARRGNTSRFQGTVQLVLVIRGLLLGALLLAFAGPIATTLFNVPEARWAFAAVAVIPVLYGFVHVDFLRWQRDIRFGPSVTQFLVPEIVTTLLAWPVLSWFGDYAGVLWLILGKTLGHVLLSHLLARRPYRLAWSRATAEYILSFGWPLLLNGLLLFGVFHGDRVIIGNMLTMTALGLFTAAFTLAQAPRSFAGSVLATIALPVLAQRQTDRLGFQRVFGQIGMAGGMFAGGMVACLLPVGEPLIRLVFGENFAGAAPVFGWLLGMHAVRLLRVVPNQAAIAVGDTRNLLICNVFRVIALAGVVVILRLGGDMVDVAAIGFAAELVAYFVGVLLLALRWSVPPGLCLRPAFVGAIWPVVALVLLSFLPSRGWIASGPIAVLMGLGVVVTMLVVFPVARREALLMLQSLQGARAAGMSES